MRLEIPPYIADYRITIEIEEKHSYAHQPHAKRGHQNLAELITPSATLSSLQRKGNIITAFCVTFGVVTAIQKLRSYLANWLSVIIQINSALLVHRGVGQTGSTAPGINTTESICIEIPEYTQHIKQHIDNTTSLS